MALWRPPWGSEARTRIILWRPGRVGRPSGSDRGPWKPDRRHRQQPAYLYNALYGGRCKSHHCDGFYRVRKPAPKEGVWVTSQSVSTASPHS